MEDTEVDQGIGGHKEVGEQGGCDVEKGKLFLDSDAEGEGAKVGDGGGDEERGAAKEGGDSARLPHHLPANLLTERPIRAVW